MNKRPALNARENTAVDVLGKFFAAKYQPAARPAKRLVCRRRYELAVRHR